MKYSNFAGVLRWSGGTIILKNGQRVDENHPVVSERPELFGDSDTGEDVIHTPTTVERATAAPGEIRNTPGTGPRGSTTRVPKGGSAQ